MRDTWLRRPRSVSVRLASGPIFAPVGDPGRPAQVDRGQQGDVGFERDVGSTQVVAGSTTVTPARMCASRMRAL